MCNFFDDELLPFFVTELRLDRLQKIVAFFIQRFLMTSSGSALVRFFFAKNLGFKKCWNFCKYFVKKKCDYNH